MAGFIILTYPLVGHVTPAVPIVRKLIEHGHEVVWISGCLFKDRIEAAGARFFPLPSEIDPKDRHIYELYPQLKTSEGLSQVKCYLRQAFLDSAEPMIKAIDEVLKNFHADVLIGDSVTPGVFFKSELSGIPSVMLIDTPLCMLSQDTPPPGLGILPGKNLVTRTRDRLLNFLIHGCVLKDIQDYANQLRKKLGLQPFTKPLYREYYETRSLKYILHLSTPSFEYPRNDLPDTFHFIGPILPPVDPNRELPKWWPDLNGASPVILINQGTVANNLDDVVIPAVEGLKFQQMLIIAVPVQHGDLGPLPGNVRTAPFIPFADLLPHVDVMITNGGYGATQMALAHGIPLVIAGATEDKMEVAARVEWSGCGINLRKKRPTPQNFLDAVNVILNNTSYSKSAKRLQAEIRNYDAPVKAVELLERLIV